MKAADFFSSARWYCALLTGALARCLTAVAENFAARCQKPRFFLHMNKPLKQGVQKQLSAALLEP